MKTQFLILIAAYIMTACTKPTIKPEPTPDPDLGIGQVLFWQQNTYDYFTVTLGDNKGSAAVHVSSATAPDCNTDGLTTLRLFEGNYTYSVVSYKGKAASGSFTVKKDKCLQIEVVLK